MHLNFDFAASKFWHEDHSDDPKESRSEVPTLMFPQSSWDYQDDRGLDCSISQGIQTGPELQCPTELLDASALKPTKRISEPCQFDWKWPEKPFPTNMCGIQKPDISVGIGKRQVSRDLVHLEEFLPQKLILMYYQDCLCQFDRVCWKKLSAHQAAVLFKATLQEADLADCLTNSDYRKLIKMVSESPEIQQEEELEPPPYTINFLDGTLDLGTGVLYRHNPDDGFFRVVRFSYQQIRNSQEQGIAFESFIRQVSNGNPEIRQQILELIALILSETNLKRFYVLLGPSNTGKSQIGKFLEKLVGEENVVAVRGMHDFSNQWTTGSMQGKRLASCLDLPDKPLPKDAAGIIKQMVGDDTVKIEEKYKSPGLMRKKPILFFAGNYPLHGNALDEALLNRMVIIPFTNPCPVEKMKQELFQDFFAEAPYIIEQAICAFQALMDRNFQVTCVQVPEEYSPQIGSDKILLLGEFVDHCCELQSECETETGDLFCAFCHFLFLKGHPPMSEIDFSRQFNDWIRREHLSVRPVKRVNGCGSRGYQGIRVLPEYQASPYQVC
ncbi:DNA primase family protein [Pseudoflavonifractor phocaeensis]|uniref:DNA primase family protein n=1 Tax=Pseudoflavonifractor phocaeensis TaxID=1870988 RepID=UPI00195901A2|nr:DUF5906 domain-containing protein [Pseudoflavonifractor phocaeensis]MBM6926890.1 hypothetical protein [Pseudoflavonifractor phocaeensis]